MARPGDEVVLLLPENPTTGYRWQIDRSEGAIELIGDGYQAAEQPEPGAQILFGRGSVREFRFRVGDRGAAHLALRHWQEWEGERSIVATFATDVTVSETD